MEGLESFFTVSQQLKLFLLSFAFGIPLGMIYDIFRSLRGAFAHGKILVALEDVIFFVLYGIFMMSFTAVLARSEYRFYFSLGNLLGFILYNFTLSRLILPVLTRILTVFRKLWAVIFFPLKEKIVLLLKKSHGFLLELSKKKK